MKEWAVGVIITVFFTSTITLILPNGKLNNTIKSIFSFLLILVIMQPLFNLKNFSFNFSDVLDSGDFIVQIDYIEYINEKNIEQYKENCKRLLEEIGVSNVEIEIEYKTTKSYEIIVEKVVVNLKNSVIKSDKDHIDIIDELKRVLGEYFSIQKSSVVIYE